MTRDRDLDANLEGRIALPVACLALALMALIPLSQVLWAQSPQQRPSQPESLDRIMNSLTDRLDLTPEQQESIRPILAEDMTAKSELVEKKREQGGGRQGMRGLRSEMKKITETTDGKLAKILSEDQMKEYEQARDEMRKKMRERMRDQGYGK